MGRKRRSRAFKENKQVIDFEHERRARKEKRFRLTEKKKVRRAAPVPVSGRRTGKKTRRCLIYFSVALVIICVIGFSIYNVLALREERAKAEEAKLQLEKEKSRLEKELSLVDSDEYIEEKARGQLHMIREGEKIYVLPGAETSESAMAAGGIVTPITEDAIASNGALMLPEPVVDGGDGEDWISSVLTGIQNTFHEVVKSLKDLVRK